MPRPYRIVEEDVSVLVESLGVDDFDSHVASVEVCCFRVCTPEPKRFSLTPLFNRGAIQYLAYFQIRHVFSKKQNLLIVSSVRETLGLYHGI